MKRVEYYSVLLLILLLIVWEIAAQPMSELVLPTPTIILLELWDGLKSGFFLPHILRTGLEVISGLLIGCLMGFTLGVLMGEVDFLRKLLYPYVIASQAVPKIALAPLFILWFGFGMTSKVVITALVCFFPVLENTASAIQFTEGNKKDLFYILGATRLQTLIRLKIPAGLPAIMAGFRVAVVLAVVGAVVGEFIGGNAGLGAMIIASQSMMDTPLMFAILILLTIMSALLYQVICLIEKRILKPYMKGRNK